MKKYLPLLGFFAIFEAVAITLWLVLDNIFYLFNFTYIGAALSIGIFFYIKKYRFARNAVQIAVGAYMLIYLGIVNQENMQIEGFWYYLFSGTFEAAVIHYAVAKIFGPFIFSRGWCGYACWTAAVTDLLPNKRSGGRKKGLSWIRYAVFAVSLIFVGILFILGVKDLHRIMFISFIAGNLLYYALGIGLSFALKDNRAFCKYICPVSVFMKPASYFSFMRIKCDTEKCTNCGACKKVCPMDVDMTDPKRSRKNGTECILCLECVKACKKDALKL